MIPTILTKLGNHLCRWSILASLALNMACNSNTAGQYPFPIAGSKELSGPEVLPPMPLMSPRSLYLFPGNILVLDKYDGELATRIPIDNPNLATRVFRIGNGPNEFLKLSNLYYDPASEELEVVDGGLRKCYRLKYNRQLNVDGGDVLSVNTFSDKVDLFTLVPFRGGYFSNGCFGAKMFTIFDKDLNELVVFGDYPGDQEGIGTRAFFLRNQTTLAVDPSGQYFCAAGVYTDWLVIYKVTGDHVTVNMELFTGDAALETISHTTKRGTSNSVVETGETRRTYRTLYAGNHYLYALYWGIKASEMEDADAPCYVVKFSYDGEQVETYRYNKLLYSIAVDEEQGKMYGITYSPLEDARMLAFSI